MKKSILLTIATFFLSITAGFCQSIDLPLDSVTTLLCNKWEVDYALVGAMKISRMPGATEINYEFKKDKTFLVASKDPKDRTKGTWNYDPKKKIIRLTTNGKSNSSIISLKKGELVIRLDQDKSMPADIGEAKVFYKIKTE